LLAVGGGMPITWLALNVIFGSSINGEYANALGGLVWAIWLAALFYIYLKKRPDLFMLAGGCLSGIVVVTVFLTRHLLDGGSAASFLLLALLVIGLGTGAAIWLRNIHRQWQS